MLKKVKEMFVPKKDYAGRRIEEMIDRLNKQRGGDWMYNAAETRYEDTLSTNKVYPHETSAS